MINLNWQSTIQIILLMIFFSGCSFVIIRAIYFARKHEDPINTFKSELEIGREASKQRDELMDRG